MFLPRLFDASAIPVLEQAVNFSEARHNVLAGNLANQDVPGYRTRDLSPTAFQARLKEAIRARDRQGSMAESGSTGASGLTGLSDDFRDILYHDESNVSLEHQVAEMSKNQMQHNFALAVLASQFKLLQAAISERA